MSKSIFIDNQDLGFWTQTPISVVRYDDDSVEIAWCNHAGAHVETDTIERPVPDGQDLVYDIEFEVCDRCGAVKRHGEDFWDNAPEEGVFEEGAIR